ncbi:MAG: sensor domain-containing diguanylate cyclase [Sulfurovum sp.]|nr:sensor domain-containing diguanylate cyclase [Sulfurovum sp.]
MEKIIQLLSKLELWHFVFLFTVLAIISAESLAILQSYWLLGDFFVEEILIIIFNTAAIVAFILLTIIASTLHYLRRLQEEKEELLSDLHQKSELLRSVIDENPDPVIVKNWDGKFILVNNACATLYGSTADDMIGKDDGDYISDQEQAEFFKRNIQEIMLEEKMQIVYEDSFDAKTGEKRHYKSIKIPYKSSKGERQILVVAHDITKQKEQQEKLDHMAHYDALTNLPNRVALTERIEQAMAQTMRREELIAIAYIDLDGFKEVNDTYGHTVGDSLLKVLSLKMTHLLRKGDTVARFGGDEFIAVLLDLNDKKMVNSFIKRFLETIEEPLKIDGFEVKVSASIGVTFYPQAKEMTSKQLIREADQAMYQAKISGKNRSVFFEELE